MRYSFKLSLCNVSHVLHILRFAVRMDEMISSNRLCFFWKLIVSVCPPYALRRHDTVTIDN